MKKGDVIRQKCVNTTFYLTGILAQKVNNGNYLPNYSIAECDPDGEKPCCFKENDLAFDGECSGLGSSHCTCRACVDYRLVKRVRQAQPDGNCALLRLDSGFLKYVCFDESSKRLHYKCFNSDSKYKPLYSSEAKVKLRGVSNVCKNDLSVYQACGFYRARPTDAEVLCGGYLCDHPGKRQGKYIECTGDHCKGENRDCDTSHSVRDVTLCNDICEGIFCEDEKNCNGYVYGLTCENDGVETWAYVNEICDGHDFCDDGSDERNCTVTDSSVVTCIQDEENEFPIPLRNYTRCSVFNIHDVLIPVFPYCNNYLDQTNCSDPQRIGGYCSINGFVSSVSKYVVCSKYGDYTDATIELCDDDLHNDCVFTFSNCTLHKHKKCDGIKDCHDGSDESDDICQLLTSEIDFVCTRKFNPKKENTYIPVSWIMDGTFDCMNGEDEGSDEWTICPGEFKKILLPGDKCQDVFRCPAGDQLEVQFANLCDGVESCGDGSENNVCRIARDFPVIEKETYYNGSLRDVCRSLNSNTNCVVKEFNLPWGKSEVFGVVTRKELIFPTSKIRCRHLFGENYLYLSCMDLCLEEDIICPLGSTSNHNILPYDSCPGQIPDRAYTVVNNSYLTFVISGNGSYHQDVYQCRNSRCVEYKKVCDLIDDCGDMSDEIDCTNHMICVDSLRLPKHQFISLSQKCDGIYDCFDLSDECNESCGKEILESSALKITCWMLGVLAMLLNFPTVCRGFSTLRQCETKTTMTTKALMILIASGDLCIGVYLVALSIYDSLIFGQEFCKGQAEWLTGPECIILGIISTLGSQISLFTMTVLSIIRMRGVSQMSLQGPMSKASNLVIVLQGLTILWASFSIAVAPLVPALEDYFVQGMYYNHTYSVFIGFPNKARHIKVLQSYYGNNITEFNAVNISHKISWREIGEKVDGMFSQDFGTLTRSPVHFYGNDGVCLFKYFVRTDDARRSRQSLETGAPTTDLHGDPIVWAILALNFCCFVIITYCYIVITYKTKMSSKRSGQQDNLDRQRNERAIQSVISVIIATDFLCWVPFIIICALHNLQYIDASSWYAPFAMTVLPLNSVINPLVYDKTIVWSVLGKLSKLKSVLDQGVTRSLAVIRRLFNGSRSSSEEIEMNTLEPKAKEERDGTDHDHDRKASVNENDFGDHSDDICDHTLNETLSNIE